MAKQPRRAVPVAWQVKGTKASTPLNDSLRIARLEAARIMAQRRLAAAAAPAPAPIEVDPKDKVKILVKSGLLTVPTLLSQKPSWWRPPPEAVEAAKKFDERHRSHVLRAERALKAVGDEPNNEKKQICFKHAIKGLQGNKYFIPESLGDLTKMAREKIKVKDQHDVIGKIWTLPTSIWGPRPKNADSNSFHDTEELMRKCLEIDWKLCLQANNNAKFIASNDRTGADWTDIAASCFDILLENVNFVYSAFDYYATIGTAEDIIHVKKPGYKRLIDECSLIIPGSKHCAMINFDQLFALLNSDSDYPNALTRQEWLQMLMRVAARRYLFNNELNSLAEALTKLIKVDLRPKVDRRCLQDSYAFRERYCYNQDVDEVLLEFEPSLKALFTVYAYGDGLQNDEVKSTSLMDYLEWRMLLRDLSLIQDDFRDREAALTFVWARMRVADERPLKSRVKSTQLSFVDFLDCVVRMAKYKAMPSKEQIYDAGCEDAGEFILMMREKPAEYAKFIQENMLPWDAALPEDEGIHLRLVDFCYVLVRSVKTVLADDAKRNNLGKSKQAADAADAEQALDKKKVKQFKEIMLRKLGDNPLERR